VKTSFEGSSHDAFSNLSPLGYAGNDTNLYRYVGNNPLANVDPSGLCACGKGTLDDVNDQRDLIDDLKRLQHSRKYIFKQLDSRVYDECERYFNMYEKEFMHPSKTHDLVLVHVPGKEPSPAECNYIYQYYYSYVARNINALNTAKKLFMTYEGMIQEILSVGKCVDESSCLICRKLWEAAKDWSRYSLAEYDVKELYNKCMNAPYPYQPLQRHLELEDADQFLISIWHLLPHDEFAIKPPPKPQVDPFAD